MDRREQIFNQYKCRYKLVRNHVDGTVQILEICPPRRLTVIATCDTMEEAETKLADLTRPMTQQELLNMTTHGDDQIQNIKL